MSFTIQGLHFEQTTKDEVDPRFQAWWNLNTRIGMPKRFFDDADTWVHEFTETSVWKTIESIIGYGSNRAAHHIAALTTTAYIRMRDGLHIITVDQYWDILKKHKARMPLIHVWDGKEDK